MLWLIFLIPILILLIIGFVYDKKKKAFNDRLKKAEGRHFIQSDISERENLIGGIDIGCSDDSSGHC